MGPPMKTGHIIFRGDATILEHRPAARPSSDKPTVMEPCLLARCAYQDPAFGQVPEPESFTSGGGTAVRGVVKRNKPDFSAPNGVNTSVNFFRAIWRVTASTTSMVLPARPHAAGAALIQQAAKKFNDAKLSPPDSPQPDEGNGS